MADLKPCPFCGGKASMYDQYETKFTRHYIEVSCQSCGASMLDFNKDHCLYDVIRAWNRREKDGDEW